MLGKCLIGKTVMMQGFVQPVPAAISGKDSAGSISSMSGGSKAEDIEAAVRITESRYRPAPVRPVAELLSLCLGDRLPIGDEARTSRAVGDSFVQHREGTHRPAQSIRWFKFDSRTVLAQIAMYGVFTILYDASETRSYLPGAVLTASMNT